jgi:hypothetical protein
VTPRELLRQSVRSSILPALSNFGYTANASADSLSCVAGEIVVGVKFSGARANRGKQSTFTSSWWVSSPRYRRWQQSAQLKPFRLGLLFARNDWLLPGWPLDTVGFAPSMESEYDRPNVNAFVRAASEVAVPLFASLHSPERAAEWALANLDPLDRESLLAFLSRP